MRLSSFYPNKTFIVSLLILTFGLGWLGRTACAAYSKNDAGAYFLSPFDTTSEAEELWNAEINDADAAAAKARAWRPEGIQELYVRDLRADLAVVEDKLAALDKKLDEAIYWADHTPPSVGLKFDGQRPVVTGVMKHAAEAGVRVGDTVVAVGGVPITNVKQLGQLTQDAEIVDLTLARGDKVRITKREAPAIQEEKQSLANLKREAARLRETLDALKTEAGKPKADLEALAARSGQLSFSIDGASHSIEDIQMKAYKDLYKD